jgi:Ca2+-binding RTX toxin-like protein
MTTYSFETIGSADALAISASDTLLFAQGPASAIGVRYSPLDLTLPARIEVTVGDRTVAFGTGLADLTLHGGAILPDGSKLFVGSAQDDRVTGTDAGDGLYGGAGADSLDGGRGADFLQGNSGDDSLTGGFGANIVYGGQGDDLIIAANGAETAGAFAHGNMGHDEVIGGGGNDTLLGGQGDDFIAGRNGDDYLSGDLGEDELHGGQGADTLLGGAGKDVIQTGGGADRVLGGDGDDLIVIELSGGAIVDGQAGNDTIVEAGLGKDLISGGEGRDRFEFVTKTGPTEGQDDVILDWEAGDQLHFAQVSIYSILPLSYSEFAADSYAQALAIANQHIAGPGAVYVAAQVGADVIVFADTDGDRSDGADIAVVLAGTTLADIGLENFV